MTKLLNLLKNKKIILNFLLSLLSIIVVYPDVILGYRSIDPSIYYQNNESDVEKFSKKNEVAIKKVMPPSLHVELSTAVFYEKPINKYIGDSLKKLEFPFWNPNNALGMPMIEQYSTRVFFPLQIIENLISFNDTTAFQLIRIFLTIFFILLSCDKLYNMKVEEKLLIGIYIASSSIFTWFLGLEQLQNVAVSGSILLYSSITFGYLSKKSIIINGILIGLLHLSGQPESAFFVLLFILILVPFLDKKNDSQQTKFYAILGYSLSNIIGIAISLVQIIPFLDAIIGGHVMNELHGLSGGAGIASPSPLTLLRLYIFPSLSTYPKDLVFYPINGHWDAVGFFISAQVAFIFILSLIVGNKKSISNNINYLRYASLFYLIIITLKNFGVNPFYQIGHLPLFNLAWSQRWGNISLMLSTAIILITSIIMLKDIIKLSKSQKIWLILSTTLFIIILIDSFNIIPKGNIIHGVTYLDIEKFKGNVEINIFGPAFVAVYGIISSAIIIFKNNKQEGNLEFGNIYIISILSTISYVPRNLSDDNQLILCILIILLITFIIFVKNYSFTIVTVLLVLTTLCIIIISPPYVANKINNDLTKALEFTRTNNRVFVEDLSFYGNSSANYSINTLNGIFSLPIDKIDKYLSNYDKRYLSSKSQPPWYVSPLQYKNHGGGIILPKDTKLDVTLLIDNSVEWLVCTSDICSQFDYIKSYGKYKIYKIQNYKPRIAKISSNEILEFQDLGSTILIKGCFLADEKILIRDAWYPGWRSTIEGEALETALYDDKYRYIRINKSVCGTIRHFYIPKYFYFSLIFSSIFLIIILLLLRKKC